VPASRQTGLSQEYSTWLAGIEGPGARSVPASRAGKRRVRWFPAWVAKRPGCEASRFSRSVARSVEKSPPCLDLAARRGGGC